MTQRGTCILHRGPEAAREEGAGAGGRPSLTCCAALSASTANSTDRPLSACFRDPHVLLFRAAQEGSGVVSDPNALKGNATGDTQGPEAASSPSGHRPPPNRSRGPRTSPDRDPRCSVATGRLGVRGGRVSAQNYSPAPPKASAGRRAGLGPSPGKASPWQGWGEEGSHSRRVLPKVNQSEVQS